MKILNKKNVLFVFLLTLMLTSSLIYANQGVDFAEDKFEVGGQKFDAQLEQNIANDYISFIVSYDPPPYGNFDKSEIALRVYYEDRDGNRTSKNFGTQTRYNSSWHEYNVPSEVFNGSDVLNKSIYKVKGWYRVTKNGESKSGELYTYSY